MIILCFMGVFVIHSEVFPELYCLKSREFSAYMSCLWGCHWQRMAIIERTPFACLYQSTTLLMNAVMWWHLAVAKQVWEKWRESKEKNSQWQNHCNPCFRSWYYYCYYYCCCYCYCYCQWQDHCNPCFRWGWFWYCYCLTMITIILLLLLSVAKPLPSLLLIGKTLNKG